MSLSPEDVLNKKKSLNKRIDIENIKLNDVNVDDLKFNGNNYNQYIIQFQKDQVQYNL